MGKMKNILICAAERYAREHTIDVDTAHDLILNSKVFGDKDLDWLAAYAAGKEEEKMKLYEDVVAPTKEQAEEWVRELKEGIKWRGYARVAQLYELAGRNTSINDWEHCWTNEEDIHFIEWNGMYRLNLPQPVSIAEMLSKKAESEKKSTKVKVYFAIENDLNWPDPEVLDAYLDRKSAVDRGYIKATVVFDECVHNHHYPTLEHIHDSYVVIDEEDDIRRSFYVVEKEVEV